MVNQAPACITNKNRFCIWVDFDSVALVILANDVEVLKLKVHTIIHRTSEAVIDRLREYIGAELTRSKLETAVQREQDWQQKRSELFVYITGKGKTRKQVDLQEMWAGRAARAALGFAMPAEKAAEKGGKVDGGGMSVGAVMQLRKRSRTINTTGQRFKQEVRWIEKLKDRAGEMTERRAAWKTDPKLVRPELEEEWALVHTEFLSSMILYDQLERENWDPMTSAAAPADLGETQCRALLDGDGARTGEITPPSAPKKNVAPSSTKVVKLGGLKLNSALYSVAYAETLVLCGSVECADAETKSIAGFGYLSWLYWVESLLGRFEQELATEGMAERFALIRVGTERFKIMALPAPSIKKSAADQTATDARGSEKGSQASLASSGGSSTTDGMEGGRDSLAWAAEKLLQIGVWMLDEVKATNNRADRIDRTSVNAHHDNGGHDASYAGNLRVASPTTGMLETDDDDDDMESALNDVHYTHGGRKGLMQTHRVSLRVGVASGQCAAYALGMSRPAFFHLKGPLVEGADKLCAEAEPGSMLMSPAVESVVGKTVDGLTRVQLKGKKEARTAEEQAALEAEKELEDGTTQATRSVVWTHGSILTDCLCECDCSGGGAAGAGRGQAVGKC